MTIDDYLRERRAAFAAAAAAARDYLRRSTTAGFERYLRAAAEAREAERALWAAVKREEGER